MRLCVCLWNLITNRGGLYKKELVESEMKIADERDEFGTELSKKLSSDKKRDQDVSVLGSQRLFKK